LKGTKQKSTRRQPEEAKENSVERLKPLDVQRIAPRARTAMKSTLGTARGVQYFIHSLPVTEVFVKTDTGWCVAHAHNTPIDRQAAEAQ
jgi:hypothetical protein